MCIIKMIDDLGGLRMDELEYRNFMKRYDRFKKNNLPTPFWDEERQTLEYVYFYHTRSNLNYEEKEREVHSRLSEALGQIAFTGFYYSFTDKHIVSWKDENGKFKQKTVIGHSHAHSFEEVVEARYDSRESFHIAKEEEQYYSKQELEYLKRVQKYLLFIGMKDLETSKKPISRYRNKIHSKYEKAYIYKYSDETIRDILNGKRDFRAIDWYLEYSGNNKTYKPKEYQALIVDKDENFKMFIEFTHEEVKFYKDVKKIYKREDLKDDDKLIIYHFKIIEVFD